MLPINGEAVMATYAQIQRIVREKHGFIPKTCWIADVKSDFSLTDRVAPNRMDARSRKHPCPLEKRQAIIEAL
jgi:hypothetical protein